MESASADDVRARGSPKGLVLAPLQAQAQHYPKGEGWKRSQFGSRKRSQTDRQTDAPTTTTLIASGPPLRGDPYFVCISTTLLRNKTILMLVCTLNLLFISPQFSPLIHCAKNLTVSAGTKEIDCEVPEWCTQVGNEH